MKRHSIRNLAAMEKCAAAGNYDNKLTMKNKKLIERAENFIIWHDKYGKIIKDGSIKKGAEFLAEFFESELAALELPKSYPMDEEIYKESLRWKKNVKVFPFEQSSFQAGAQWMRDKIGNND